MPVVSYDSQRAASNRCTMPAPPYFFPAVKSHPDPAAGGYPQEFIFLKFKNFQADMENGTGSWEKNAAFFARSKQVEHFLLKPNIRAKLATIS